MRGFRTPTTVRLVAGFAIALVVVGVTAGSVMDAKQADYQNAGENVTTVCNGIFGCGGPQMGEWLSLLGIAVGITLIAGAIPLLQRKLN